MRPDRGFEDVIRVIYRLCLVLTVLVGAVGLAAQQQARQDEPVMVLTVEGAVSPAMSDYIRRNLDDAVARNVPLVVLKMDTPGGLDSSMRQIIGAILASPVPVATWVAPSGARAASAGTYILYASHIAAMAPATNLGAATPVAIGGGGEDRGPPFPSGSEGDEAGNGDGADQTDAPQTPGTAMERKAINDAVAYIRGLAELRGRDAEWAEQAVRAAVSLTSSEAARRNVIDFVASDLTELLERADNRTVAVPAGDIVLATAGRPVEEIEPDWRTQLLAVITNPNVALILMLVGVYGLIFEFLNPGVLVPGTIGGISLILGLYSLALLPLNYAGIALILLGLALIVAEAFAPSFGILGIGGTVALVLGAVILVDTDVPGVAVSVPLIAGVAVSGVIATLIAAWMARQSLRAKVVSGAEEMIGTIARVTDWEGEAGHVWVHGERWSAAGVSGLAPGDKVRITALDGLVLKVDRAG
jgi:membrane-bound serine protease (ClpP class)